jgi:hypothetical protein
MLRFLKMSDVKVAGWLIFSDQAEGEEGLICIHTVGV